MPQDNVDDLVTEKLPSEPPDTQPLANIPERNRRKWIPATWAAAGAGGGHPKLSGGFQADAVTGNPVPRSFNRPDQRYAQPTAILQTNRTTRAASEYATSVILVGPSSTFEIRSASGNSYDVGGSLAKCDCPDWLRLQESAQPTVTCKHIEMVKLALADPLLPHGPDWSAAAVAENAKVDVHTIRHACQRGWIAATKRNNVWLIPATEVAGATALYTGLIPHLASLSPTSAAAGSGTIVITLTGSNFNATSHAVWKGATNLSTILVSPTELQGTVPAVFLASPTVTDLRVENAFPGGGTSTALQFTVL